MIATYLRLTISYIIEHFSFEAKRHYALSFNFILCSILFVLFMYALFSLLLVSIYGSFAFWDDWERLSRTFLREPSLTQPTLYRLGLPLCVLCSGLYGSFVISTINDERLIHKSRYALSDFLAFISTGEWISFLLFSGLIFSIYFLTNIQFTSYLLVPRTVLASSNVKDLTDFFDPYTAGHRFIYRFLHWIDTVIELIKTFLPFLFSVFFIITVYEKRVSPGLIRKYQPAIIASLIAAASITSLIAALYQMLSKPIIAFMHLIFYPPHSQIIPNLILFVLIVAGAAYLNWALAASFCLPIKMKADEDGEEEVLSEPNDLV